MRIQQVMWTLVGSVAVFVACSAQKLADNDATQPGVDGGHVSDAVRDAITELRDALADATGIDVSGEPKDAIAGPTDPEYVAGTRIKPKFTTTSFGDGAKGKQFSGWYDSARGEDCQVQTASDGKQRCLPVLYGGAAVAATIGYFSDSACAVPLYLQQITGCTPGAAPKYVYSVTTPTCGVPAVTLWPVAGIAANPTRYYYKPAGSTACSDAGAFPSTTYRTLSVGAEIAPSTFVELTTSSTTG